MDGEVKRIKRKVIKKQKREKTLVTRRGEKPKEIGTSKLLVRKMGQLRKNSPSNPLKL